MEHILLTWLRASPGRRFLLIIAGRLSGIHGWKREHMPIACQLIDDSTVIIRFDGSERLTISGATGVSLHPDGELSVQDAREVRFTWCSDEDPTKDCEEIFTKVGKVIAFSRTDDLYTTSMGFGITEDKLVLLR
ncbi:MAG TPA: hypothetical protein VFR47_28145 [Anaerolineales bacterium]|nr:hypothetical protein [Anaerolineales bacterium]